MAMSNLRPPVASLMHGSELQRSRRLRLSPGQQYDAQYGKHYRSHHGGPGQRCAEAGSDQFVAYREAPLIIAGPGVLQNDKDVDHNSLKAVSWTQPAHGTLTPNENGDGGFKYVAAIGYSGEDSFTYKASDGAAASNEGKVSIYVKAIPNAHDDYFSVAQNTAITIPVKDVLANDVPVSATLD